MIPAKCPEWGRVSDCLTGRTIPKPGDVSICIYCSGLSVFDHTLNQRPATEQEKKEIYASPKIHLYLKVVQEARKRLKDQGIQDE